MNTNLVTEDDLKKVSGFSRSTDLERWLIEHRIKYFKSNRSLFTTIQALNNYLKINDDEEEIEIFPR